MLAKIGPQTSGRFLSAVEFRNAMARSRMSRIRMLSAAIRLRMIGSRRSSLNDGSAVSANARGLASRSNLRPRLKLNMQDSLRLNIDARIRAYCLTPIYPQARQNPFKREDQGLGFGISPIHSASVLEDGRSFGGASRAFA